MDILACSILRHSWIKTFVRSCLSVWADFIREFTGYCWYLGQNCGVNVTKLSRSQVTGSYSIVSDAAVMLEAIEGPDGKDSTALQTDTSLDWVRSLSAPSF